MVFIRGPHPEASIWRHFRGEGDGFTFGEREGVSEAMVMANADRIVELFLALAEHLPPAVTVEMHDVRAQLHWRHLRRVMGAVLREERQRQAVWDDDEAIARAIGAGDAATAVRLIEEHGQHAGGNLAARLTQVLKSNQGDKR